MTPTPLILVVDIESTSLSRGNAGIVEIGAVWLSGPSPRSFEIKLRPHADRAPDEERALEINGCDWLDDPTVASEPEAIAAFAQWIAECLAARLATIHPQTPRDKEVIMAGHNLGQFDFINLRAAFARCDVAWPFAVPVLDMHSLACQQAVFGNGIPAGGMSSRAIYKMLDMPEEPKPHRALRGATMERAAIRKLLWHGEEV